MGFLNRSAIITGGGRGIGREIALLLADNGSSITIGDQDLDAARLVAEEINHLGGKSLAIGVDVSKSDQVIAMVSTTVRTFGTVDILVNNAGIGLTSSIIHTTDQDWDRIQNVNLKGNFLCSREAAKVMINQGRGGQIINISSTAADNARVQAGAYCASKAGVLQLTKVLALELGPHGITTNAICPGLTDYATGPNPASGIYREAFLSQVSLGRVGLASDIAQTVEFLVSGKASFINGEVIHVDGGYSAGKPTVRD